MCLFTCLSQKSQELVPVACTNRQRKLYRYAAQKTVYKRRQYSKESNTETTQHNRLSPNTSCPWKSSAYATAMSTV